MNKDDYEVGYGKPPKKTQFKAGQSGNPKGRPRKKTSDLGALVNREFDSTLEVTENGIQRKLPMRQVFVKRLISKAFKGERWAVQLVLNLLNDTPEEVDFEVELDDLAALEKYKASIAGGSKE